MKNKSDPKTPYYAVIFFASLKEANPAYDELSQAIALLAESQPGYLGKDSVSDGINEITTSYWQDKASILAWKTQSDHLAAQQQGRQDWFSHYHVRITKVEREYQFIAGES